MNNQNIKPLFSSNKTALIHYQNQVNQIELKSGRSFEDLLFEAEQSLNWTDSQEEIFTLHNTIKTLNYLINKEKQ